MPPPFRPVVQEGDRARIVRAHADMFESKGVIYQLHFQLLKVASIANSNKLRQKVTAWLDATDMLVSTSFDIEHFQAQLRDRASRGLNQFIPGLQQTLGEVQARHDAALAVIGQAEDEMEEAYVELVPPGNRGRTRAELRKVFNEKIKGPKRPKKVPKLKGPPNMRAEFTIDADFGGPQGGRKMRLETRKGGGGGPGREQKLRVDDEVESIVSADLIVERIRLLAVDFEADVKLGGPPGPPGHRLTVR